MVYIKNAWIVADIKYCHCRTNHMTMTTNLLKYCTLVLLLHSREKYCNFHSTTFIWHCTWDEFIKYHYVVFISSLLHFPFIFLFSSLIPFICFCFLRFLILLSIWFLPFFPCFIQSLFTSFSILHWFPVLWLHDCILLLILYFFCSQNVNACNQMFFQCRVATFT